MKRRKPIEMILASVCAFVASSLWYSPLLFGRQFLQLSGLSASTQPNGVKIAVELLRNLLLTFVGHLLANRASRKFNGAVGLAAILWLGFPFTLLSGSIHWRNTPLELGIIHSGDWLIKTLLITTILWIVNRDAGVQANQTALLALQRN